MENDFHVFHFSQETKITTRQGGKVAGTGERERERETEREREREREREIE